MTMKLACLRCKHKKIKCDKGEPICHQCVTAGTECTYVERRKRPRLSQQKSDVRTLSRRLEYIEKHLTGEEHASPSSPQSREESMGTEPGSEAAVSPSAPVTRGDGQESWIYRLASDTRRNLEKVNTQSHPTPAETPNSATVDSAMSALNEALNDLGKLNVRPDETKRKVPDLDLTPEQGKACVKIFREMVTTMIIPDAFITNVEDIAVLDILPDIDNSPYVNVDPGVRVLYYNALYYGLHKLYGPSNGLSLSAYYKVLEAVPAWLNGPTGDLDGHIAALTAWTAINNFDYQLSWKFHCKSCQFLKMKGIDRLDALPTRSHEEEEKRQNLRYLFWHTLQTDLLFRLFYNKPSAIRWSIHRVKPPSLFSPTKMHPSAIQATLYVVWLRYTILTSDIFNVLDGCPPDARGTEIFQQVDDYCDQLEELITEWDLMNTIKSSRLISTMTFLYADHVMNMYASIIGVKRLIRRPTDEHPVDAVTLRAARMVVSLVLYFNSLTVVADESNDIFFHFMTFYPFCAVFSLYEHVIASSDPDTCEDDLQALQNIGSVMKKACGTHPDFVPLSNTINALNKVSRTVQENRRNNSRQLRIHTSSTYPMDTSTQPTTAPTPISLPGNLPSQQQQQSLNLPAATADAFQMLSPSSLDAAGQPFPFLQDFSGNVGGDVQPLDFIRALESDFIGRNWHETWWDMDGDINVALGDFPTTPYTNSHESTQ